MAGEGGEGLIELRDLVGQLAAAVLQVAHAGTDGQVGEAKRLLTEARRGVYRILAEDAQGDAEDAEGPDDPTPAARRRASPAAEGGREALTMPAPHRLSRLGFVNAYLVEEDDGLTLVDTMLPRSGKAICSAAADDARRARSSASR